MPTTLGRHLVDSALPAKYRGRGELTKGSLNELLVGLAKEHPDLYPDAVTKLKRVGDEVATLDGISVGLDDIAPRVAERDAALGPHAQAFRRATATKDKEAALAAGFDSMLKLAKNHPGTMGTMVRSGGRGNAAQLMRAVGAPVMVRDSKGKVVPWLIDRSFSEGLKPADAWVAGGEARVNAVLSNISVVEPGDLAKILVNNMGDQLVTTPDCGTKNGVSMLGSDPHVIDRYLTDGRLVTPHLASELARDGKAVTVRSPMTCEAAHGVCQRCQGLSPSGAHHLIGTNVGVRAAQALCLDGDTEVRMADGSVQKIRDIYPGDQVLGCSVEGELRPVRVLDRFANGKKVVYETKFRLGTGTSKNILAMVSSLDHKALTVTSSKTRPRPAADVTRVEKPRRGRFYAKLSQSFDDATMGDPAAARFALAIGVLIGDGCYTGGVTSNGVSFSCHDDKLVEDLAECLREIGCKLVPQTTYGEYRVTALNGGKAVRGAPLAGIRNPIRAELVRLGLWGQYSHTKQLPNVSGWSNKAVADLIAGLFATDGCVHIAKTGRICLQYGSTSRALVEAMRYLLMTRFGVYPSSVGTYYKKKKTGGLHRPAFKITINGHDNVTRFTRAIRISGVKGPKLSTAISAWSRSKTSAEAGRCAFVSQTRIGLRDTFDIHVDHPDHLFMLANGLIVSNSEPLTQFSLNAKHGGRVGGAGDEKKLEGIKGVRALLEIPSSFMHKAVLASRDGEVSKIAAAPQGGHFVHVGDASHYVPPEHDVVVKVGTSVYAGDLLSDGVPKPDEIVEHKGLGEGRRYLVDALADVYKRSGSEVDKRHLETLAKSVLNHVQIVDPGPDDAFLKGDVVDYNRFHAALAAGKRRVPTADAAGETLAEAALHHTAGTVVTAPMLDQLASHGVTSVQVATAGPRAVPVMRSASRTPLLNPDWLQRLGHRYLKESLLAGIHRGDVSNLHGASPVPAYAAGAEFGLGQNGGY